MTGSRSGWRSLVALVRGGKEKDDRPESDEPTADSVEEEIFPPPPDAETDEELPAEPEDEGSASAEDDEGEPGESEEEPPEAAEEADEPEEEDEPEAEEAEEQEEETVAESEDELAAADEGESPEAEEGGEPTTAGPDLERSTREERLEEEVRALRAEVARLEASLEEQSAARKRMAEEVGALADHDPLTGLASERRFADRLSVAIVHAQRHKQKLAVVQLGIDRFARINDKLGRSLGDDVLKSVALALESTLRQADTIARFGGDVFTLLLPGLNRDEEMTVIADKLRLALRSPFSIGGHDLLVTASLGVALFPDDGPSVESLLQNATVALKRAKARGGDSWDVHAPRSRALAAERQAKESALRRALVQNDLELFWQPVVECETGAIVGVEALLRWENPRAGADADFVSLAEVAGLAVPLGHWTLRAACRQAHLWHQAGHRSLVVSVNVSERQLHHPALLKLIRRVLDETSLPPSCLELEISEGEIRRQPEHTIEQLTQLRELGLRVALDGFGTEESRLGHLYRLPIDTLKIDPSVVAGATSNRDQEAVVTAAVALARSRKLRVVAEGVETEAQRVLLVRWQCDRMQGSLCGAPAAAIETEGLLLRQRKAGRALADDAPGGGTRRLL
jgi:diguanylate cyclase (GGDEF)-like protein